MGGWGCRLAQDRAHADRQLQLVPAEQGCHGQLAREKQRPRVRDARGAGTAPATLRKHQGALADTQSFSQNTACTISTQYGGVTAISSGKADKGTHRKYSLRLEFKKLEHLLIFL